MTFNVGDVTDVASLLEEQERQACIEVARVAPKVAGTGSCVWCSEPVLPAALYCDQFCREDHKISLWAAQQKPGKLV